MTYNPTVKKYSKDLGVPIPNVRICPSERPRLNTWPAPYLPLQLHNERHDEYYVVLTGKVVALDSRGFIVPAGLALQLDLLDAELTANLADTTDLSVAGMATLSRYDQTDIDNGVVNARGNLVKLGEPVVLSFFEDGAGDALPQYDVGAAATSTAYAVPAAVARTYDVLNHIGFAPYSYLRTASDSMERAADENEMHPDAASGTESRMPYDPTQLRHLAWELQGHVGVLVADECLEYPVVANRNAVLIEGQAVAIGANMAAFGNGARVSYNVDSDIVVHDVDETALAAAMDGAGAAADAAAIAIAIKSYNDRCVGTVIRKNTRFPSSYLNHVKTRWEAAIPGFSGLDRMPGSATDGLPWHMHTAGATLGTIQISPLVR